jgi:hypothetical protein
MYGCFITDSRHSAARRTGPKSGTEKAPFYGIEVYGFVIAD